MANVSGAAEELNVEDEQLRAEFEEFGETIKGKITDRNRPLLVKKLNHLRARRRMSEKLSEGMLKATSPKAQTASRRGRGKRARGRAAKNEAPRQVATDETGHDDDQLNGTFSVVNNSPEDQSPPKRSKNMSTAILPSAHDGPYAVARKRATATRQSAVPSVQRETTSASVDVLRMRRSVSGSSSQATESDVPRRGRICTPDDLKGNAKPSTLASLRAEQRLDSVVAEQDSEPDLAGVDGVKRTSLVGNKKGRVSAAARSAKLPLPTTQEVKEPTSSSAKLSAAIAEETSGRRCVANTGQKHAAGKADGESSMVIGITGKETAAGSRIPKFARFPMPSVQKGVGGSSTNAAAAACVSTLPSVAAKNKSIVHVMDATTGKPAVGMAATLAAEDLSGMWTDTVFGVTDAKGTTHGFSVDRNQNSKKWRFEFETGSYFYRRGMKTLYPTVEVVLDVAGSPEPAQVALAVSPYGYSVNAHLQN